MRPSIIYIPDFLANWPFSPADNAHKEALSVTKASNDWVTRFLSTEKKKHQFEAIRVGLLATMAYPKLKPEHLRTACDAMSLLFVTDDVTDLQSVEEVNDIKRIVMDCFRCEIHERIYLSAVALILII